MEENVFDKIHDVDLKKTMETSYIDYAMSVIAARALPDVRDGLKPVQRRVLYSMIELNNGPDKPHRKCARQTFMCGGSVRCRAHEGLFYNCYHLFLNIDTIIPVYYNTDDLFFQLKKQRPYKFCKSTVFSHWFPLRTAAFSFTSVWLFCCLA